MDTDEKAREPGGIAEPEAEEFDREIRVKNIVWSAFAIVAVTIASMVVVYLLLDWLKGYEAAQDVRSPVEQANVNRLPPEPRLQPAPGRAEMSDEPAVVEGLSLPAPVSPLANTPREEMKRMRREEERILSSYGWVDREGGIARIPIERAIDILAEKGLPASPGLAMPPGFPGAPGPPAATTAPPPSGADR